MPTPATKRLFDAREFEQMGRSGILTEDDRVELIEGEIIEMAPIGSEHAGLVDRIVHVLCRSLGDKAIVRVQNPIRLGERSEPQPDLAIVRWRDDFYSSAHPGPEGIHLLVEVAETSSEYDREVKLPLYARHGIPVVWLVNLPERQLEVYREPFERSYRRRELAPPEAELRVEGLPDFAVAASMIYPGMKG